MAYAGFGGLGEPSLEFLDYEQNQHLPGQGRAILQSQQNQFQSIFLHSWQGKVRGGGAGIEKRTARGVKGKKIFILNF